MDRREDQFQLLTICQKLFNVIMNWLASQTRKTITLGDPRLSNGLAETPNSVESQGSSNAAAERKLDPSSQNLSDQGLSFRKANFDGTVAPNEHDEPPPVNSISDIVNNEEQVHSCYDDPGKKEQQNPIPEVQSQEKVEIIEWRKRKLKKISSTERTTSVERNDDEIIKPILKMGSGLDATSNPSTQQLDEAKTS
ncbi:hypothetical protein EUGRSUZ_H04453 [Eucalyptus grandis]|uniref:Uncharacterized protein n=2 Tax=Eucalyptus grandis TaxID=71139 RepID=A0ACC3JWS6_EUCGR|nr:hypothetical protein EUGRSUZ_H04453 [Eucalyptus grandis]